MPSAARAAFEKNRKDVERLAEIHGELTGPGPGYKPNVEVLNKSGIVLMCAVWEAYCEDLAAEAVDHLVTNVKDPISLPKRLRQQIAGELEKNPNDLAVWTLAGEGWRTVLKARLLTITAARNRALNNPMSKNIGDLFEAAVGIPDVPSQWRWKGMSADQAQAKLDKFVATRGDIAHRSTATVKIKKKNPRNFAEHAERLVDRTDAYVNDRLTAACGVALF